MKKTETVMHVVPSLDFGGVEKHMEIIAKYSGHSRFEHIFVALGQGGHTEKRIRQQGCKVVCLGCSVHIPNFNTIKRLYGVVRIYSPEIVHAHNLSANFHGLVAAWLGKVPVKIAEVVGAEKRSAKARMVFRWIYRLADLIIGVSKATSTTIFQTGEAPKKKVLTVHNPVEFQEAETNNTDKPVNRLRIGSIGRLEAVKNYDSLIRAVHILKNKGVSCEFWLVGDGSQRRALESLAISLDVSDSVHFLGYRPNPSDYIVQCHVYVQPSHAEAFGIAIVEAMGLSIPVIATSVGGAPEIVKDNETGWLLEKSSPEIIAQSIESAWGQGPERLTKMGLNAKKSVAKRFGPLQYIYSLDQIYLSRTLSKSL